MRKEQDRRRREEEAGAFLQAAVSEEARQEYSPVREEEPDREEVSRDTEGGQDQPDRDYVPREVTDGRPRDGRFKKYGAGDEYFNARGGDDLPCRDEISREVTYGKAAGQDENDCVSIQEEDSNSTGGSHPPSRDGAPEKTLRQQYPQILLYFQARKL